MTAKAEVAVRHRGAQRLGERVAFGLRLVACILGCIFAVALALTSESAAAAPSFDPPTTTTSHVYDALGNSAQPTPRIATAALPIDPLISRPEVHAVAEPISFSRYGTAAKSGAGKVFWSGGRTAQSAAEKFAVENGGSTLELTSAGRAVEAATEGLPWSQAKPLWNRASAEFAEGAQGTVHVFHNAAGVSLDSVWRGIEYPILQRNGVKMIYHTVGEGW